VLEHRGRLANQLWNLIAIAAFAEERDYWFRDLSGQLAKEFPAVAGDRRRSVIVSRWSAVMRSSLRDSAVVRASDHVVYLPPSRVSSPADALALERAERSDGREIFFDGWPFKNPEGIARHRAALLDLLQPTRDTMSRVEGVIEALRRTSDLLVGVHLRQGDYKTWLGGKLALDARHTARAMREFLEWKELSERDAAFVICSDEPVDMTIFDGLKVTAGPGTAVADLICLSRCDWILGSNSTFGGFASWYGDKPFVIMNAGGVEWSRYGERHGYVEDPAFVMNLLKGIDEGFKADGSFFEE
jgi:hypothetical protein